MADEEQTETDEAPAQASGGGLKSMLIMGAVGIVLLGAGVVLGPVVTNMTSSDAGDAGDAEEAVEPKAEVAETDPGAPALYQSLLPPLVINIQDADGDAHFMQMSLEVMSRDQDVINALRDDTPAIRNGLILLYSGALYEEVTTREGKEKLLADGLAEIRKLMKPRIGAGRVEALYFTALVIQ